MTETVWNALLLTTLAGMSTGIGSLAAFWHGAPSERMLARVLSFSAGMMLSVSCWELLPFAWENSALASGSASLRVVGWFMLGVVLMWGLHHLFPEPNLENPNQNSPLLRMGMFSALALAIHNFPEGLATFAAGLSESSLGLTVMVAIALHNIPEGLALAVPLRYATGSRKKAFWLSFGTGLFEPMGALLGYWLLQGILSPVVLGAVYALTAGIMIFLALHELLPAALRTPHRQAVVPGLASGMALMGLTLVMLQ